MKEYTEGNFGGPGAGPPEKNFDIEVTQPYFLCNFLMQKWCGRSMNNP